MSILALPFDEPKPEQVTWPQSLWSSVTPAGPRLTNLRGTRQCDAVVIGAGFTGLSAALHLVRAGKSVIVVEAKEPGWGASGRNNGQIIPTLSNVDPDDIVARHHDAGERFLHLIKNSAAALFDFVRTERTNIEAEQTGWIQPVGTSRQMKIAERRVAQWARLGAPMSLLGRDETFRMTGSGAWQGGWWNPTGGHINPLALVRELARAVLAGGGMIFSQTPAITFGRVGPKWVVTTPQGRVTAHALVLATNAYTGEISNRLAPDIAREMVPVQSWQLVTKPLGDNVRRTVLPHRSALSDAHGTLNFARLDARQRLVVGGTLARPLASIDRLKSDIAARLQRLFPQIGEFAFDHVWSGSIGMTRDSLPRIHHLGPGGYAWVGCNGRAVALSIALGREFSRAILGAPHGELGLPFTRPDPLPMHGLVRRIAPLILVEMKRRDRLEG